MTVNIRPMEASDLNGVVKCLQSSLFLDSINSDVIREKTTDAKDAEFCHNLCAVDNDMIVGFVQGVRGERRGTPWGWIRLFGVHADHQNKGIGKSLLKTLEDGLWSAGVESITTFDSSASYLSPGVDFRYTAAYCFFTRAGYRRDGDNLNLLCDVSPERADLEKEIERLDKVGFNIRRMKPEDRDKVVPFLASEDWPMWIYEIDSACENDPRTVWLCWKDDEVVGFCAAEGNNKKTGWFGPMGVSTVCRGQRIGNVLCSLSLADIADLGHKQAIIPWVGPVHFYWRVCGAQIDRTFWVYRKDKGEE